MYRTYRTSTTTTRIATTTPKRRITYRDGRPFLASSREEDPPQAIMAVPSSTEVKIPRRSELPTAIAGLVAVLAAVTLLVGSPKSTISRDEAIRTALHAPWNQQLPTGLVAGVKLIHRYDLPRVIGQDGATDAKPWDQVWVVVLKGDLVPATMPGGPPPTYTVEVIRDRRPAVVEVYVSGRPGERPANWDQLMDLE